MDATSPNGNGDVLGLLADALCEHNDDDAPPETWPAWTDNLVVGIGPAFTRAESLCDSEPPDDIILLQQINATRWTRWLAGPGEPQP